MKRQLLLIAIITVSQLSVFSQLGDTDYNKRSLYAETYIIRHDFSDGFVSLNYERMFGINKARSLSIGVYPDFESTISFPIIFHRLFFPKKNHHFEYGFGAVIRFERYEGAVFTDIPALIIPIMYRFQKNKGMFIRAGVNVFLSWPTIPSPSLSIGYTFKQKVKNVIMKDAFI